MPLHVGTIVEGQGEYQAVRCLLERVWYELLGGDFIEVLRPFRQPQGTLLKEEGLKEAVDAVKTKLGREEPGGTRKPVLVLIDSEEQCPMELAPRLLRWAQEARADADVACVLPNPMFETWFVAAARSLAGVNDLPADLTSPDDPEGKRLGKSWIKRHLPRRYSETVDQARLAAGFDLAMCRANSPSFDKLCRELSQRLPPAANAGEGEQGSE